MRTCFKHCALNGSALKFILALDAINISAALRPPNNYSLDSDAACDSAYSLNQKKRARP
jgi:hypothetical protein